MRNDRKDARLDPKRSCFRSIGNLYEVQRGNYEVIPFQRRDGDRRLLVHRYAGDEPVREITRTGAV